MENNPIDDLSKAIDEKKVRVTFGLQPSDIEKIEVRIKAFDGALYSQGMWEWAAKDIGWHPLTAALYYFKYLNDSNASLQSEIDRLKEERAELIKLLEIGKSYLPNGYVHHKGEFFDYRGTLEKYV